MLSSYKFSDTIVPFMKRLSKVLASAGIASRRFCEKLIFEGKVSVNGDVVLIPQTLVSLQKDKISVNGSPIKQEEEKVCFILNKPKGYICSNAPMLGKKLVIDLFKTLPYRLFSVGRLDRDTTGLLLITNDGHFANRVIHPSKGLTKEYLIKTTQEITHEHLLCISKGALIENTWIKPVNVTKMRKGTLKIVVREGKKREVRLLVQKANLIILSLHRIRIGPLILGNIAIGDYRPLSEKERALLLSSD
jgi:23S rRNA pseudouridine2605 synthase